MQHRSVVATRLRAAILSAVVSVLALACATQPAPEPVAGAPATPVQQQPAPLLTEAGTPVPKGFDFPLQPADGKWLTDKEGRKYFVHEVGKIPGSFVRVAETHVKFWYTPPFELVREDEQSFYVKIYGTGASPEAAAAPVTPAAATATEVAESYKPEGGEVDRLRLVPWSDGLPTHGQWRQGFAVADVDGDGQLDIVHGPPRKGGSAPAIFLGDGKGHWKRWTQVRVPADRPLDYGDAAAADFNGDGVTDLAFASHLRGLSVLVGDGKGSFKSWSQGLDFWMPGLETTKGGFTSRAIDVADWNGDGRPDLVALSEGPTLSVERSQSAASVSSGARGPVVFLNGGDGTWSRYAAGGNAFGDAFAIGRFDGDDRPDLVTASASMGNQDLLYRQGEGGTLEEAVLGALRAKAIFRAVAAADFDGDGREDVAVGYTSSEGAVWRSGVDVLLARPEGAWERRAIGGEESNNGVWGLASGDLDGNGTSDIVATTGDGKVWIFLGDGKGSFDREASPELTSPGLRGCTGYHVLLRDLDGDGQAELVASFAGESQGSMGVALGLTEQSCSSGGGLRAWKVEPASRR